MKKRLVLLLFVSSSFFLGKLSSQELDAVLYSVNLGPSFEMFSSPSLPFTISLDRRKRTRDLFAWVSGLKFNYTDNDRVEGFFSRSEVDVYYAQAYGGVRLYASKRTSKLQYFAGGNLGLGGAYLVEGPFSNEESGLQFLGSANANIGVILKNRFIITPGVDLALNTNEVGFIWYNFKLGYQFGL